MRRVDNSFHKRLKSSVSPASPAALEDPPYGLLTRRLLVPAQLPDRCQRSDERSVAGVCVFLGSEEVGEDCQAPGCAFGAPTNALYSVSVCVREEAPFRVRMHCST